MCLLRTILQVSNDYILLLTQNLSFLSSLKWKDWFGLDLVFIGVKGGAGGRCVGQISSERTQLLLSSFLCRFYKNETL